MSLWFHILFKVVKWRNLNAKSKYSFWHLNFIVKADDWWKHDDAIVFLLHPTDQNKWLEMDEQRRENEYHTWNVNVPPEYYKEDECSRNISEVPEEQVKKTYFLMILAIKKDYFNQLMSGK